jgi:uncharacterized membrane protein
LFGVVWVFVTLSGMLHAVWNLFAKRTGHSLIFLWSVQWVAVVAFLPWVWVAMAHQAIPMRGWVFLDMTATLHGFYVVLLARTYAAGDLSQVYPLMRGVSPPLVPILGMMLLGERMSGIAGLGIVGTVTGIGLLGDRRWRRRPERSPLALHVTEIAMAVGLAITSYTVLDKVTLQYILPVTLNDASNFGNLLALSWAAARSGAIRTEWTRHWRTIIVGGILLPSTYLLFLLALRMDPVAQMAPMRESGTVFDTMLGIGVLKERHGPRRLEAAGVMTMGLWALRRLRRMIQNPYDDDTFLTGYRQVRESGAGLNEGLEQPAMRSLVGNVAGLDVLDLGCGIGQFAAYCAR